MTSVEIIGERGCWEMPNFPTPSDPHSHRSADKNKNPYPLRNCKIPNLATTGAPGTTHSAASWFLDPDSFGVGNYVIFQWVRVLAIL